MFYAILLIVWLISSVALGMIYSELNVKPNFWSILSLFLPIVNTLILLYLIIKRINFSSFMNFINDLKRL